MATGATMLAALGRHTPPHSAFHSLCLVAAPASETGRGQCDWQAAAATSDAALDSRVDNPIERDDDGVGCGHIACDRAADAIAVAGQLVAANVYRGKAGDGVSRPPVRSRPATEPGVS